MMTNKGTTKRALLFSVLSMLLCISMLIGTTFAWFTDSVSSMNNIIKSGNLDIELDYWNGTEWKTVQGSSEVLDKDALWEPGYTEVVYLRLTNKGSLAVRYQLGVNMVSETEGVNVYGDSFKLSDYIFFDVVEGVDGETQPYATREEAVVAATETTKISNGYAQAGTMLAGDAPVYMAMVVYMPETVGNEANHNGKDIPEIQLGMNVFATQLASEEDSFGNDYDADYWAGVANTDWYDANATDFVLEDVNQLAGLAKLVNTGVDNFAGKSFKLDGDIDLMSLTWTPIGTSSATAFAGTFDGNGKTVSNLKVVGDNGNAGLFGYVTAGTSVSNLNVHNAIITDEGTNTSKIGLGAVIGTSNGAVTMENVHLTGLIQIGSVDGVMENGALIGYSKGAKITDCSVIGDDGSFVASYRWVGAIVGYDNTTMQLSGCRVENITLKSTAYCGGLTSVVNQKSVISGNAVKNVDIVLENAGGVEASAYGALLGSSKTYSYSSAPYSFTAYDNTVEGMSYTVNGVEVAAQDFGAKVSDGTDPHLAMAPTIKVGNSYYSYLKFATSVAPKDGSEYVIELTGDTVIRAKFKPTVASGQNIVIKTNGYKLLNVEQDSSKNVVFNDDGTPKTTVITNENVGSYITIKTGGSIVIE